MGRDELWIHPDPICKCESCENYKPLFAIMEESKMAERPFEYLDRLNLGEKAECPKCGSLKYAGNMGLCCQNILCRECLLKHFEENHKGILQGKFPSTEEVYKMAHGIFDEKEASNE